MKSAFWVLPALSVVLLGACATTPMSTPVPATIPTPELTVPSHFVTYSDGTNSFSISYPSGWERIEIQEYIEKALVPNVSSESIEAISLGTLFMSGLSTGKGHYSPHETVVRPPFSTKGLKLYNLVEAMVEDAKDTIQDFKVLQRTEATIDGRQAIILEIQTETFYADMERAYQLQMLTFKDNSVWVVTCTSQLKESARYKDDFYRIVESFRILK